MNRDQDNSGAGSARRDGRTTLVVVHDAATGTVELVGAMPGPAGSATAECGNGVTLTVDALDPTLVLALHVEDRTDLLAARTVEELVGPEAVEAVMDVSNVSPVVTVPAARTEAFTAAARLGMFGWHLDMFPLPVDRALTVIEEIVHRADLAAAGLPIDEEISLFDIPDLLSALHRHLTDARDDPDPLPAVIGDGIAVARQYLDSDAADLGVLEQLAADHAARFPAPAATGPAKGPDVAGLLDAFGPTTRREPAFAALGDQRRDSLEWHRRDVVPVGFDRTEDAIVTQVEGTYVRVTTTVDPEALSGGSQAWAVVFEAKTGSLIGFAPGRAGTDPLGQLDGDALATTWTAVLTLPPDTKLNDIYVAIRTDPRLPGEDEIGRALGQPKRNAIRAKIYADATDSSDVRALETACKLLKDAIEGFVRIADRYRSTDHDRSNEAFTSAQRCKQDHDELLAALTADRGGRPAVELALEPGLRQRLE